MKHNTILIKTIRGDLVPTPAPTLIADLVEAVLRAPGLRVKSVEVADVEREAVVTRRIREVKAARSIEAKPQMPRHNTNMGSNS
jgi:hypothetical protein